jgi:hypothetical protein
MKRARNVETTVFSDTESEGDAPVAREESMRHDTTFQRGGRTRRTTTFLNVLGSPVKRARVEPDLLLPDIPEHLEPEDDYDDTHQFMAPDTFEFDEGHPLDKGPRNLRDSVSSFGGYCRSVLTKT